jgi:hypothetical protein
MQSKSIYWSGSALLAVVGLAFAAPAQAIGFGGYAEYGHAEGESDLFPDSSTDRWGLGFALDTNLAADRVFNYRLTVGYQNGKRKFDGGGSIDTDGFTMNHAFGFGVVRKPGFRFWLGPAVRLSVDVLDVPVSGVDVVDLSFGAGPELGLNWNIGEGMTLSTTLAYQLLYVGEIVDTASSTDGFDGFEHLVSLNLSFFFRLPSDKF